MLRAALAASLKPRPLLAWLLRTDPVTDGSLELTELCDVVGRSKRAASFESPFLLHRLSVIGGRPSTLLGDPGKLTADGETMGAGAE
jgi:hypothetical protein